MVNNSIVAGVDIGGSHITAALVNLASGKIEQNSRMRCEVNSDGESGEIISKWSELIERVFQKQELKEKRVGIAMPGPFDYKRGYSLIKDQGKFDALYKLNVKNLLAEKLGVRQENIRMMNDAACFLSGEVFNGAAKGCNRAMGLTLGTGFGTAFYEDGIANDGSLWEHPFKGSIAEDYFCTRWFVQRYQELSAVRLKGVKELVKYTTTDSRALDVFEEFGQNLSEFLTSFIIKKNPEIIILGGNISQASDLFLPALENGLAKNSINIPVRKTTLGEDACLMGAASCWEARHAQFEYFDIDENLKD